jgi:hypothetical protein
VLLSLIQGGLGAFIGLVGLFVVFWLTLRHDAASERKRAAEATRDRRHARVGEAISEISAATSRLVLDLTTAPLFGVTAITSLTAAVMKFALEAGDEHSDVAAWALAQQQILTQAQGRYHRRYLLPWGEGRRLAAWNDPASELAAKLVLWHTGKLDDAWFERSRLPSHGLGGATRDWTARTRAQDGRA